LCPDRALQRAVRRSLDTQPRGRLLVIVQGEQQRRQAPLALLPVPLSTAHRAFVRFDVGPRRPAHAGRFEVAGTPKADPVVIVRVWWADLAALVQVGEDLIVEPHHEAEDGAAPPPST
jgi:hypothetical protein